VLWTWVFVEFEREEAQVSEDVSVPPRCNAFLGR